MRHVHAAFEFGLLAVQQQGFVPRPQAKAVSDVRADAEMENSKFALRKGRYFLFYLLAQFG